MLHFFLMLTVLSSECAQGNVRNDIAAFPGFVKIPAFFCLEISEQTWGQFLSAT